MMDVSLLVGVGIAVLLLAGGMRAPAGSPRRRLNMMVSAVVAIIVIVRSVPDEQLFAGIGVAILGAVVMAVIGREVFAVSRGE
jgi:hypothetical protein